MSATGPLGTTDAKAGSSVASRPTSLVCVDRVRMVSRIVPSSPSSASRRPAYGPGAGTPCQRAAANTMFGCFFSPGSWSTQARTSSSAATPSAHSTKHGDSPSQCAANSTYWAATPPYGSTSAGQSASATYVVSRYSSIPSKPPSRPKPLALTPPNGAAGFDTSPVLTPIMPKSSASASRIVRWRSRV